MFMITMVTMTRIGLLLLVLLRLFFDYQYYSYAYQSYYYDQKNQCRIITTVIVIRIITGVTDMTSIPIMNCGLLV